MNFIIQKDEYFSTLFVDPGPSFVNATNITNISDSVIKFQNIIIDSATFVPEPVPTGNDLPLGIQKKLFLDDFDDQLKLIDSNGNIEFTSFDQNLNTNSAVEFQLLATPESFIDTITQQARTSDPAAPPCPNCIILYTKESNTLGKPDLFYRTSDGTIVNLSSQATGNPFNQNLDTVDDVIFNSVEVTSGGADITGDANITGNVIGSGDIVGTGNVIGNQLVATSGGANITGNIQMTGNINNVINITTGPNNGNIGTEGQTFNDIFVNVCNTNFVLPLPAGTDKSLGNATNPWNNLYTNNIKGNGPSSLNIDNFSAINLISSGNALFAGTGGKVTIAKTGGLEITQGGLDITSGNLDMGAFGSVNTGAGGIQLINPTTANIGSSTSPFTTLYIQNILPNGTTKSLGSSANLWDDVYTSNIKGNGTSSLNIDNFSEIFINNLTASDPGVPGQLWNDSGTLKISSGP